MKKFKKLFLIMSVVLLVFETNYSMTKTDICYEEADTVKEDNIKKITRNEMLRMNSELESQHIWNIANRYGYVGRYQLGRLALMDMGYDTIWINQLQNSIYKENNMYKFDLSLFPPHKQNEAILKYIKRIEKYYLGDIIKKYVDTEISGVKITKAGILSASFLGFSSVRKFVLSNGKNNPSDGNGHTVKDRLKMFENYELI